MMKLIVAFHNFVNMPQTDEVFCCRTLLFMVMS